MLKLAIPLSLLALTPVAPAQGAATGDPAWQPHRATRVLYAGWPDGSREREFAGFLRRWFDVVGTCSLEQLSMQVADGYDVVIADWCSQYGNDGYPARENSLFGVANQLGPEFTKPIVALDYVSSNIRRGYKLDWL